MNGFHALSEMSKMLRNLDTWIAKALEHAQSHSFEANVLVTARLYPDQYSFDRQVQSACDSAKFAAAHLCGKEAPKHPDTEKTMDELRARIASCLGFLETVKEKDFAGAADRKVSPPWMKGKWVRGEDYLFQLAIPNFFFHATTAYAILRHNGVPLGKMDYIGSIPMKD
jgi:uncharacterized protein